ncbi:MAG TPA: hypothetical protein VHM89_13770, partial [Acidimicrobiales bacterium]|nr:hypothetical protein [Acidimicrobiales bacterium]
WCLGDPRQSQSVGAGGLAAEVARLGAEGAIVAPELVVNRRQRHVDDRAALAELRAGHAAASQAIRTESGWEHEEATPLATREAMAGAVAADVVAHGPEAVVALAVSHADCEDLADRIRARLIDAGHIGGRELVGPGWGSGGERSYAAGDRVLLHTKPGPDGLHNGSVGTVVAVGRFGLRVAFDDQGEAVVLRAAFVAGRRHDGNPNLSHAWARTVEGGQGGTWEVAHLLGTASLDALVGYTGQSRSKAPTHTWNTRPLAVVEVGGLAADYRSAAEVVLGALTREPVSTFAAVDDPWILHARLDAEREEHLGVLRSAPPDLRTSLHQARTQAEYAARVVATAGADLEGAEVRLGRFGPLAGLRRSVRLERDRADQAVARARERLGRAHAERRQADQRVVDLEAHEARRVAFVADTTWRFERVRAINAELDRHWSTATLAAVRQDDPLAFGVERLRAARATYAANLARLDHGLPSDRTRAIGQAERKVAGAEQELRHARLAATAARRDLDVAFERHWGRRDKQALERCRRAVERAEAAVVTAVDAGHGARRGLEGELAAQRKRAAAVEAVAPQRGELCEALGELDAALDDTRAARVAAMATQPLAPTHLAGVLGEAPEDPAGRAAWCGLAYRVEAYRDRHSDVVEHAAHGRVPAAIGPRPGEQWCREPEWDDLAERLAHGVEVVATASALAPPIGTLDQSSSWLELVDRAGRLLESEAVTLERGIRPDHGMGLGL